MTIINSISDSRFSINGMEYLKNYVSNVCGDKITIYNCYERKDIILPYTRYDVILLNGDVYSNSSGLHSALQDILFLRNTLVGPTNESNQDNKGKSIYIGSVSAENLESDFVNRINSLSVTIQPTDSPVIFWGEKIKDGYAHSRINYLWMGGKGVIGVGGQTVSLSEFYPLPESSITQDNISKMESSVIIPLGEVQEGNYINSINSSSRDLSIIEKTYYFSYSNNEKLDFLLFTGTKRIYNGDLIESDFVKTDSVGKTNIPDINDVLKTSNRVFDNTLIIEDTSLNKIEYASDSISSFKSGILSKLEFLPDGINIQHGDQKLSLNEETLAVEGPIVIDNYLPFEGYDELVSLNVQGRINLKDDLNNLWIGSGSGLLNTTGSYNTAYGQYSLYGNETGYNNVAIGNSALAFNVTGYSNIAIGLNGLLQNNSGYHNVGIGYKSLENNTSGYYNVALGSMTMSENTIGNSNTALGYFALKKNINGIRNCAFGNSILSSNTSGSRNTSVGDSAMSANTTGSYNTAIGRGAMLANTTGDYNIAIGNQPLSDATTASLNIAIGTYAGNNLSTGSNNIILGRSYNSLTEGITTGNNNVIIGSLLTFAEEERTSDNQIIIADGVGNRVIKKDSQANITLFGNSLSFNSLSLPLLYINSMEDSPLISNTLVESIITARSLIENTLSDGSFRLKLNFISDIISGSSEVKIYLSTVSDLTENPVLIASKYIVESGYSSFERSFELKPDNTLRGFDPTISSDKISFSTNILETPFNYNESYYLIVSVTHSDSLNSIKTSSFQLFFDKAI